MIISAMQSYRSILVMALFLWDISFHGVFGEGFLHPTDDTQVMIVRH